MKKMFLLLQISSTCLLAFGTHRAINVRSLLLSLAGTGLARVAFYSVAEGFSFEVLVSSLLSLLLMMMIQNRIRQQTFCR